MVGGARGRGGPLAYALIPAPARGSRVGWSCSASRREVPPMRTEMSSTLPPAKASQVEAADLWRAMVLLWALHCSRGETLPGALLSQVAPPLPVARGARYDA